jgi:hypothetical protein
MALPVNDSVPTLERTRALVRAAVGEVDADGVLCWRYEQLVAAGFEPRAAARLARRRDLDLHAARSLVQRGCPPETALRILL